MQNTLLREARLREERGRVASGRGYGINGVPVRGDKSWREEPRELSEERRANWGSLHTEGQDGAFFPSPGAGSPGREACAEGAKKPELLLGEAAGSRSLA